MGSKKAVTRDYLLSKAKPKKQKEQIQEVRIQEILDELEMTQSELSDLTGIIPTHLSLIVRGKRKSISLPIALKIARALNKNVEEIFIYE